MNKQDNTIPTISLPKPDLIGCSITYRVPKVCPLSKLRFKRFDKRKIFRGTIVSIVFNIQISEEYRQYHLGSFNADGSVKPETSNVKFKRLHERLVAKDWKNYSKSKEYRKLLKDVITLTEPIFVCVGEAEPLRLNFAAEKWSVKTEKFTMGEVDPVNVVALKVDQILTCDINKDYETLLLDDHWFVRDCGKYSFEVGKKGSRKRPRGYQFPPPCIFLEIGKGYNPDPEHFYTEA